MYNGQLIFAQAIDHLPHHTLHRCIQRYQHGCTGSGRTMHKHFSVVIVAAPSRVHCAT